jgi:hypothetical protein
VSKISEATAMANPAISERLRGSRKNTSRGPWPGSLSEDIRTWSLIYDNAKEESREINHDAQNQAALSNVEAVKS